MKYKVGDRVKVRSDLEDATEYGNNGFVSPMLIWCGQIVTLAEGDETEGFFIVEDGGSWCWTPEMFDGLAD